MKVSSLFSFFTILVPGLASATVTLSRKTVQLPVEISNTHVKLSNAGYSIPLVKILVPALADVTILNHRNVSEGAPCLATTQTSSPEAVIQNRPATELQAFKITLQKETEIDTAQNICHVTLVESVETKVRGFVFTHSRQAPVTDRDIADCR